VDFEKLQYGGNSIAGLVFLLSHAAHTPAFSTHVMKKLDGTLLVQSANELSLN